MKFDPKKNVDLITATTEHLSSRTPNVSSIKLPYGSVCAFTTLSFLLLLMTVDGSTMWWNRTLNRNGVMEMFFLQMADTFWRHLTVTS